MMRKPKGGSRTPCAATIPSFESAARGAPGPPSDGIVPSPRRAAPRSITDVTLSYIAAKCRGPSPELRVHESPVEPRASNFGRFFQLLAQDRQEKNRRPVRASRLRPFASHAIFSLRRLRLESLTFFTDRERDHPPIRARSAAINVTAFLFCDRRAVFF